MLGPVGGDGAADGADRLVGAAVLVGSRCTLGGAGLIASAVVAVATLSGVLGLLGSTLGIVAGFSVALVKMLASLLSACIICWVPFLANGVAGDGCWSTLVSAATASCTVSADDVFSMSVWHRENAAVSTVPLAALFVMIYMR